MNCSSMPKQWVTMKVRDIADVVSGKRPLTVRDTQSPSARIPIYGGAGKTGYTEESLFSEPVLITGRVGALGLLHKVMIPSWPSDNTLVVKPDYTAVHFEYLFYCLVKRIGELASFNRGTSNPLIVQEDVRSLEIMLPPLPEQRAIAHILGTLDDKIELNRRMNQTLEAMAQALFKSWFMDFEPFRDQGMQDSPLGEIPVGWETKPLDKIADFLNGLALQKYPSEGEAFLPVIKIAELRRGVTESSGKASIFIDREYIVEDGDILFSWSGSLEICIWCGGRGALNQHLFKVTSKVYPKWFYYQWIKYYLPEFQAIAAGKATTMGHIQRYHLSNAYVAIPPQEPLGQMDKKMGSIMGEIIQNNIQSRILASIRDALLPKLISGEIRVKDAEKFVKGSI